MAQTQTRRSSAESAVRVLEQGNISFFYRPRVNQDAAHDLRDVQRLYMVLKPRLEKALHPIAPLLKGEWA